MATASRPGRGGPSEVQASRHFGGLPDRQAGPLVPLARQRTGGGSCCGAAWDRLPWVPPRRGPTPARAPWLSSGMNSPRAPTRDCSLDGERKRRSREGRGWTC